jgi:uncharacterized protein
MNTLLEPLDDAELAELDLFLLERLGEEDEDHEDHEDDPGVFSISGLDGFLAALVSGPVLVEPSQWMAAVWGDYEPEWESESDFERVMALIMRHLNTLASTLKEAPAEYQPLFLDGEEDGEAFVVVDDWCEGYVRALALTTAQWQAGGAEVERLLAPIVAFSSATDWQAYELNEVELDHLSDLIAPNVREIHGYWLQQREAAPAAKKSPWDTARKR